MPIHQGLSSEGHWAALYCYLLFTLVRGCNPFSKGQMRWVRVNKKNLFCCKDWLRPFSAVHVISQWSSNLGLLLLVQITQRLMVMAAFTQKTFSRFPQSVSSNRTNSWLHSRSNFYPFCFTTLLFSMKLSTRTI